MSRMLDDYMYDEDAAYERYLVERDEARYYDVLGFPTHEEAEVVACDDVNHTAWHGCPTCQGWDDDLRTEYDPDEMRRDGDDAHTTARREGVPTRWDVV